MDIEPTPKPYFINCHTHIFVGANIPPYIGKQFMPWPFYKLFTIPFILRLCKWWYLGKSSPAKLRYKWWYKKIQEYFCRYRSFINRNSFFSFIAALANFIIVYHAILFLILWAAGLSSSPATGFTGKIIEIANWLTAHKLFFHAPAWLRVIGILFSIVFIENGRKLAWFILKKFFSFLSMMPDKKTLEFLSRYINIGRFAYYKKQSRIFLKLKDQYPEGTGFVILPMDMEFMGAGKLSPEGSYGSQMKALADIKNNKRYKEVVFPFVAVDPRRTKVDDTIFFDWETGNSGEVILKDCFIKDYIETKKFSGFKIYPALGYYPFDETLLPLWKYAADHQLPILTHTIRGTIFYRGSKKKEWNYHPVLKQANGNGIQGKLLLPELKNVDFINNFTHPLNYLCLVEEKLLRIVVSGCAENVKKLFGYTNDATPLVHNLAHLKLCFGHFGGEDEWAKFFEHDRDDFTSKLVTSPQRGIEFVKDGDIANSWGTLEKIWKNVDWYSTIRSMMLQYPNLYADISYIIHDEHIFPLLKQTLANPTLRERVLYGTDFYVVRNHKSEKEMLADSQAVLTATELDYIGRRNGKKFLNLPLP